MQVLKVLLCALNLVEDLGGIAVDVVGVAVVEEGDHAPAVAVLAREVVAPGAVDVAVDPVHVAVSTWRARRRRQDICLVAR